ncbi:hypothetical protein ATE47_04130 [Chryseobacterium sp. IHB B 17019]|uniref:NUMOD4 domain-containing protein n=1 Tax=Chryseobacterium sp. IHB B 17019 TaxID=1721091 RepID=UPI000720AE91|nr:NUMOD4 domain-containing protein [Chryseobacterium sp. IHB B 17019]ALR29757.1 hypothetical protein ATE47_04130 [Chryseobacterium sp. IHB B 17019]
MAEGLMKLLSLSLESFPNEVWEEIPGYEDRYMVSNYARVKSIINRNPRIIKKSISSGKYKVTLVNKRGRITSIGCGRLVAKTFIREPNSDEVVRYRDENVLNDILSNIYFSTRSECLRASPRRNRMSISGERNGMAILTTNQVIEIRKKRNNGNTYNQLKDEYKVSIGCIHNIITRKKWKTV